jgi:chemotaxis response regulator CheB
MPNEAIKLNAVEKILPLDQIAATTINWSNQFSST